MSARVLSMARVIRIRSRESQTVLVARPRATPDALRMIGEPQSLRPHRLRAKSLRPTPPAPPAPPVSSSTALGRRSVPGTGSPPRRRWDGVQCESIQFFPSQVLVPHQAESQSFEEIHIDGFPPPGARPP